MTIFRVPGDFPSTPLALDSPLVQRGDTILVNDGAYNQVVVVPYDKVGVLGGKPAEAVEETVSVNHVAGPDEPDQDVDGQPSGLSTPEGTDDRLGQELPELAAEAGGPVDSPETRPYRKKVVTRSSVKMIRVEQGPAAPYWVTVHRRTLELGRTPEKRWNASLWLRLR